MADDILRMQAEVVDKFSGPLRNLRNQLLGISREGASHSETVAKGLNKIEASARSAGQTASTVLNPALAAVGVTGLGAIAALTGVAAALRSFGSSVSALGQLGRETGMAADQLRVFQSVAGRFGISSDASDAAAKRFAENMRDIRRGVGETMGFLQSQTPAVAQFALKLKNTTSNDDARKLAEEFMESIPNAIDRQRFAEKLFGNADFGRLGDKHLGPIRKLRDEISKALGPLDPATVKSAEDFEKAMSQLRTTMQKLGTAIATEAMPYVSEFVKGLQEIVKGGREDITGPLREGVREIGKALQSIDWKVASEGARDFVKDATAGVRDLLTHVREIAAGLQAIGEGRYLDAARSITGASGPLARRLAPKAGDDILNKQEEIDALKQRLQGAEHAQGTFLGRMGVAGAGDPNLIRQQLEKAQRELDEMVKLREAMNRLREGLNQRNGEATVQKQSFDDSQGSTFGGARIQTASFGGRGGGGGYRAGLGGGHGGAYSGGGVPETDPGVPGGGSPRSRSHGGGRFNGVGPSGPRIPQQAAPGGGAQPRANQFDGGPAVQANPGAYKDVLDHIARAEGTAGKSGGGYNTSLAYGKFLPDGVEQNLTGKTLDEIDALQSGMLRHPKNGFNSSAIGRYQIVRKTLRGLRKSLGLKGNELYDEQMQDRLGAELARRRGANSSLGQEWASLRGHKLNKAIELMRQVKPGAPTMPLPREEGGQSFREAMQERARTQSLGTPEDETQRDPSRWSAEALNRYFKLPGAGGAGEDQFAQRQQNLGVRADEFRPDRYLSPKELEKFAGPKPADGEGFDAQFGRSARMPRRSFGLPDSSELTRKAVKSGVLGNTTNVDNLQGKVHININKPGPDTTVKTGTSGKLFKEVRLNRGAAMTEASQVG